METAGQRLKYLIKDQGLSNRKLSDLTGVGRNYISILISKDQLTDSFIFSIKKVIPNLNTDWLEKGIGEMYNSQKQNEFIITDELQQFDFDTIILYLINNKKEAKKSKLFELLIKDDLLDNSVEVISYLKKQGLIKS